MTKKVYMVEVEIKTVERMMVQANSEQEAHENITKYEAWVHSRDNKIEEPKERVATLEPGISRGMHFIKTREATPAEVQKQMFESCFF